MIKVNWVGTIVAIFISASLAWFAFCIEQEQQTQQIAAGVSIAVTSLVGMIALWGLSYANRAGAMARAAAFMYLLICIVMNLVFAYCGLSVVIYVVANVISLSLFVLLVQSVLKTKL